MSYSSEVLADSPLAWYRMGEPSGTTLVDSSGNSRDGTYNGGVTLGSTGLVNDGDTAAVLNGTTGRADVTYGSWMDTGTTFSFEAWILTSSTGFREISSRGISAGDRAFEFRIDSTTGCLNFIKLSNGTTASVGVTNVRDGVKHHVVVTYDGANIRMYVDGALDKTTAATGILVASSSTKLSIGVQDQSDQFWWNGTLDEVAYYGTALSGARITAHYNAGIAADATVIAPAATATAGGVVPTVSGAASATVVAPTATATADGVAPVVSGQGDATVSAPAATAAADGAAPAISATASLGAPAATSTADGVAPTVSASVNATVSAPVATATAAAIAPSVSSGSPNVTILAPTAVATAAALAPVVTGAFPVGTDVSNFENGLELLATASVDVFVPGSFVATQKVDKAIGLPVPTMVNGRPT